MAIADWRIISTEYGLTLAPPTNSKHTAFQLDFNSPTMRRRLQQFGAKQLLAKAIGFKAGKSLQIIDATAGLGRDSLLIASLGCKVMMIERNDMLAALLDDAMRRGETTALAPIIKNLTLLHDDALNYLSDHQANVVYLDPMFPERKKSALVKKDMQILQELLGHDKEDPVLLECARQAAKQRVVIKRPIHAAPYVNATPNLYFDSKTHRFDVYLTRK